MAIGGLANARKVAETMSKKISRMNDGQALTANLATAFLVVFASIVRMTEITGLARSSVPVIRFSSTVNPRKQWLPSRTSRLGMQVSTTHVSVGAISGIGIVNGSADKSVIGVILLSWILTLPIAADAASILSTFRIVFFAIRKGLPITAALAGPAP
jgi:inorganic phosphate transporter, PiT family